MHTKRLATKRTRTRQTEHIYTNGTESPFPSPVSSCLSIPPRPIRIPESRTSQPQSSPHLVAHFPLVLVSPLSPHFGGFDIRGTLVIGLRQHTHHRDQNFLHTLNGRPSFRRMLVVVGVVAGGMEDGDTHGPVGVDWTQFRKPLAQSQSL